MAFGRFNETGEGQETNEARETQDNPEGKKNQILENSEGYEKDFDSRMDDAEETLSNRESQEGEGKKVGLLDKIKARFSKEESGEQDSPVEDKDGGKEEATPTKEQTFRNQYKVDNTDNRIENNAMENVKAKEANANEGSDGNDDNEPDADMGEYSKAEAKGLDHGAREMGDGGER